MLCTCGNRGCVGGARLRVGHRPPARGRRASRPTSAADVVELVAQADAARRSHRVREAGRLLGAALAARGQRRSRRPRSSSAASWRRRREPLLAGIRETIYQRALAAGDARAARSLTSRLGRARGRRRRGHAGARARARSRRASTRCWPPRRRGLSACRRSLAVQEQLAAGGHARRSASAAARRRRLRRARAARRRSRDARPSSTRCCRREPASPRACPALGGWLGDFDARRTPAGARRAAAPARRASPRSGGQRRDHPRGVGHVHAPAAAVRASRRARPPRIARCSLEGLAERSASTPRRPASCCCFEPLNRYEDHMVNTLAQGAELIAAARLPRRAAARRHLPHEHRGGRPLRAPCAPPPACSAPSTCSDSNRHQPGPGHVPFDGDSRHAGREWASTACSRWSAGCGANRREAVASAAALPARTAGRPARPQARSARATARLRAASSEIRAPSKPNTALAIRSSSGVVQRAGSDAGSMHRAERRAGGRAVAVRVPASLDGQADRAREVAFAPQQRRGHDRRVVDRVDRTEPAVPFLEHVARRFPVESLAAQRGDAPERLGEARVGRHDGERGRRAPRPSSPPRSSPRSGPPPTSRRRRRSRCATPDASSNASAAARAAGIAGRGVGVGVDPDLRTDPFRMGFTCLAVAGAGGPPRDCGRRHVRRCRRRGTGTGAATPGPRRQR